MEWGFDDLFALLGLLLVVEGLLPAVAPDFWRKVLLRFLSYDESTVRVIGVSCMVAGAIIITLVHNWDMLSSSDVAALVG
jgi:uncharacterized protein YjeT (DUF2065 family)